MYLPLTMTILVFSLIMMTSESSYQAYASHNPNLFVSAENSFFDNYFSGSMVVEVVVNDPNLIDTDEGKGEPDVTINGKQLRMVQGVDGQWHAYFANVKKAKIADQIVFDVGVEGTSLDFGVFCSSDTDSSVLGVSFSDTDGVAIPQSGGISGATNGISQFTKCTGTPTFSDTLRGFRSLPDCCPRLRLGLSLGPRRLFPPLLPPSRTERIPAICPLSKVTEIPVKRRTFIKFSVDKIIVVPS